MKKYSFTFIITTGILAILLVSLILDKIRLRELHPTYTGKGSSMDESIDTILYVFPIVISIITLINKSPTSEISTPLMWFFIFINLLFIFIFLYVEYHLERYIFSGISIWNLIPMFSTLLLIFIAFIKQLEVKD